MRGIFQMNMACVWKQCSYTGHITVKYGQHMNIVSIHRHILLKYALHMKAVFICSAYFNGMLPDDALANSMVVCWCIAVLSHTPGPFSWHICMYSGRVGIPGNLQC